MTLIGWRCKRSNVFSLPVLIDQKKFVFFLKTQMFYSLFEGLTKKLNIFPGLWSEVERPVPIPNTAVKRFSGDDSNSATDCENTSRPGILMVAKKTLLEYNEK
jgi:hypothetical protein